MRHIHRLALAAALLIPLFAPSVVAAQKLIHVPRDMDFQRAIDKVFDGGVIEVAAGIYATPPKGFLIANERKGFTVRATGAVVFDGGGTRLLLRYANSTRDRGKLVTFEGITFRNGSSLTEGSAGGVTLSAAQARFRNCDFEDNRATGKTSGGGAARVLAGSDVTFVSTDFRRNSSQNRGGAIEVISAAVTIQGGDLVENRVNLPGHKPTAAGGAVYVLDSTLRVSGALFQGNQAGWVGGAIYGFGRWANPVSTPRTLIQVSRSTFSGNLAGGGAKPPGPTTGGAIHVEDQTTLEVDSSVFSANVAEFGGAIDVYRALANVRGSWFDRNRGPLAGTATAAGGAIFVSSPDFSDASTGFGAINRRSSRLVLSDTLFQGGGAVHTGGCVLIGGDDNRAYGINGVPAAGTLAENRARFEVRRTVFSGCDVDAAPQGGGGMGGAIQTGLVEMVMEDSLVIDSSARSFGGGISIGRDANAVISRSTFALNSARSGGALFLLGATAQVLESNFLGNHGTERGAAIFSMTVSNPSTSVAGVVSGSVFSANVGAPAITDSQPVSGPANLVRYNSNRFFPGNPVYNSNLIPGSLSVAGLNALSNKSDGRNVALSSAPRLGTLLAVPPSLGIGAPSLPGKVFLAYAWSGGSANIAGHALTSKAGLLEVGAAGDYTLSVDGSPVDSARVAASALLRPSMRP